jgi:hypothetical protein
MAHTDSVPFSRITAAVSVRENRRLAEIGRGSNPHWHRDSDRPGTYSRADYAFGFDVVRTTVGTVADLSRARQADTLLVDALARVARHVLAGLGSVVDRAR